MGSVSPAAHGGGGTRWRGGTVASKVDVLRRMQATPSPAIGRADITQGIVSNDTFTSRVSKLGFNGIREDVRLHTKKGKISDPLFTCTCIISYCSSIK